MAVQSYDSHALIFSGFSESAVQYIYGYLGSTAQNLSEAFGLTFVPIDDAWVASH